MLDQGSALASSAFSIPQKFSIGLGSAQFPGYVLLSQKPSTFSWHHCWVSLDVCAVAPSCWKIGSDIRRHHSVRQNRAGDGVPRKAGKQTSAGSLRLGTSSLRPQTACGGPRADQSAPGRSWLPHHDLSRVVRHQTGWNGSFLLHPCAIVLRIERMLQLEHGPVSPDDPT